MAKSYDSEPTKPPKNSVKTRHKVFVYFLSSSNSIENGVDSLGTSKSIESTESTELELFSELYLRIFH
jgi:hypothetical protein